MWSSEEGQNDSFDLEVEVLPFAFSIIYGSKRKSAEKEVRSRNEATKTIAPGYQ